MNIGQNDIPCDYSVTCGGEQHSVARLERWTHTRTPNDDPDLVATLDESLDGDERARVFRRKRAPTHPAPAGRSFIALHETSV
jgi:hypothetical protein